MTFTNVNSRYLSINDMLNPQEQPPVIFPGSSNPDRWLSIDLQAQNSNVQRFVEFIDDALRETHNGRSISELDPEALDQILAQHLMAHSECRAYAVPPAWNKSSSLLKRESDIRGMNESSEPSISERTLEELIEDVKVERQGVKDHKSLERLRRKDHFVNISIQALSGGDLGMFLAEKYLEGERLDPKTVTKSKTATKEPIKNDIYVRSIFNILVSSMLAVAFRQQSYRRASEVTHLKAEVGRLKAQIKQLEMQNRNHNPVGRPQKRKLADPNPIVTNTFKRQCLNDDHHTQRWLTELPSPALTSVNRSFTRSSPSPPRSLV